MREVLAQAQKLAEAIKASDIWQNMHEAELRANADPVASRAMAALRAHAVTCRLLRDPALIDITGRPLLQRPGAVERLLARRGPLYDKYADFTVENNDAPGDCARRVIKRFEELTK